MVQEGLKSKVLQNVGANLTDLLNGVTLKYRQKAGNFISVIPGMTNATAVTLSPELAEPIRNTGKLIGSQILSEFIKSTDLKGILLEIKNLLEITKFGSIEVEKIEENEAAFKVYECADCGGLPNVGRPLCAYDEGMIEAILETKLGRRVEVEETHCFGTGHNFCRFEVKIL
jgi:predicted hydrocarbon binding protein